MYTLLDCKSTNAEILMNCIYLQYTPSVWYYLHTLFWYKHTHDVSAPWVLLISIVKGKYFL